MAKLVSNCLFNRRENSKKKKKYLAHRALLINHSFSTHNFFSFFFYSSIYLLPLRGWTTDVGPLMVYIIMGGGPPI